MNYVGVGVIIENQNKEYLLHLRDGNTKRMTNQWGLPGGHVDPAEDIMTTSVREIKEETGLTLHDPELIGTFKYEHTDIALVKGTVNSEKEHIILGEGADLKFFSRDEALSLINSLDYTNPFLDAFVAYLTKTSQNT
jgi:mutator protein MutT